MKKEKYFTSAELAIWIGSVTAVLLSFLIFDGEGYLELIASLIGVTALILCAKGNPLGQALVIVFSLLYGIVSYGCAYYGEMITYVGMTMPMAVVSLITWLRNPYEKGRAEVAVNKLRGKEYAVMALLTVIVTVVFYFILEALGTASLLVSTLSVATSFSAVYLTMRRSPYYAVCYAFNDIVLMVLWTVASLKDPSSVSVTVCFAAFLVNDVYGFLSWRRMEKRQSKEKTA